MSGKSCKIKIIASTAAILILALAGCSDDGSPSSPSGGGGDPSGSPDTTMIIDHTCCDISAIPRSAIQGAIDSLHIAYGHTSHGSQLTDGMSGLAGFLGDDLYRWSEGGAGNTLDLDDYAFGSWSAHDLGASNWPEATRSYLEVNPEVNVVIWSWCGQVSAATEQYISDYLSDMDRLEADFPGVSFVYMTGHLDGSGEAGNLHLRNEQIREYCEANGKILYDFADIESYDPDGEVWYVPLRGNDACDYDSDGSGSTDSNWAIEWQDEHTLGVDWYDCPSAHSQPLNANLKAYAAWCLWARLGGWDGS